MRGIDSNNNTFALKINGTQSGTITLTQGTFTSAQVVAELQSQINGDSALQAASASVSVSFSATTRQFAFTSATYGATSNVEFTAVGTSYATHGQPMIPIYIFYSMFGIQRTADMWWAAADQLARGFYIGATAGKTTLTGEGTQHMDGHSHILTSTNEGIVSYDPAYLLRAPEAKAAAWIDLCRALALVRRQPGA